MLRHSEHPCLCVFHARAESQLVESERLGIELGATLTGNFMNATDINNAMGRLYSAVAQNRIPVRNANTLARIGSTLLRTVPGIKNEFKFSCSFDQWNKMLRKSEPLSNPEDSELSPATPSVDSTASNAPSEELAQEAITQTKEPV